MSKTKNIEPKKSSLTEMELEEVTYYLREQHSRQMESNMWGRCVGRVQQMVTDRLGIKSEEYDIDWSSITDGKITYTKKEVPSVEQAPQETVVPKVS